MCGYVITYETYLVMVASPEKGWSLSFKTSGQTPECSLKSNKRATAVQ